MSQDPRIMSAAWRKFSAEREARRAALAQLTGRSTAACPG